MDAIITGVLTLIFLLATVTDLGAGCLFISTAVGVVVYFIGRRYISLQ